MVQNTSNQGDQWTIDKLMELSRWAAAERTERDRTRETSSSSRGANSERE